MKLEALWYRPCRWLWLLSPLSLLFWLITALRRQAYQLGWMPRYRAPVPVIVVGNLSVGGNGKTPVVIWLVETLRAAGWQPGVVSRGYGGKAAVYPLLLTAETPAAECGDEPRLIADRCGVPVAVAPKRAEAVQALLATGQVDLIICDDGLQHYALARDLELVVVDGERRFGNGHLLPMGPLREGLWRLGQVDAVLCNGGAAQPGEYPMALLAQTVQPLLPQERGLPTHTQVDAMAGIGHPPRFFNTLRQLGYDLQQTVAFADHQSFDAKALAKQFSDRPLLMTEKDAVKCREFAQANWWYLPVAAQLPHSLAEFIVHTLKGVKHGTGS